MKISFDLREEWRPYAQWLGARSIVVDRQVGGQAGRQANYLLCILSTVVLYDNTQYYFL